MAVKSFTVEYSGPWVVKIQYFSPSGKFYSEGEWTSSKLHMYEIFDEMSCMLAAGKRPGLVDCKPSKNEFHAVVDVPDHPHNHPVLILAKAKAKGDE
jgi:hypothetical protein